MRYGSETLWEDLYIYIYIMFNNNASFFENRALYEIMWKNSVKPGKPQMTVCHSACALHAGYLRLQTQSLN